MDFQKDLNPVQYQAVQTIAGPVLILAGPGSGKTRVLVYRTAFLLQQGVKGENILLVTFTNKAAAEMKQRVEALIGKSTELPFIGTFHALGVRILRREGRRIGINPSFLIYDPQDQLAVLKEVLKNLGLNPRLWDPRQLRARIARAKCELLTAADLQQRARTAKEEQIATIYEVYEEILRANGALDFGDLLLQSVRLLENDSELRQYYQKQFRYIMVDEYQDTNHAQYRLTYLLTGSEKNLCVVGDCSQSIYAFRGANLRNIFRFQEDFPLAQVFHLEENYRSTQNIIRAAQSLIEPNRSAHPVLKLRTQRPEGEKIVFYQAESEVDEAEFVLYQIQKLRQYRLPEIVILYRTNAQSRVLEEVFLRAGLPYRIIGGVAFYERREIKDLLAYLKYIFNPADQVSRLRIINIPPRGIGPATLRRGGNAVNSFEEMVADWRKLSQKEPVNQLLQRIIERTNYRQYLRPQTEEGLVRWENVQELLSVAASFQDLPPRQSLAAFLEKVSLLEKLEVGAGAKGKLLWEEERGAVNLMTLHAVKGLEFKAVFIVGWEEGLLPHGRSLFDEEALQEERRLAYVGLTRAEERLFLTLAQQRLYFGRQQILPPSRFLNDLPPQLLKIL